ARRLSLGQQRQGAPGPARHPLLQSQTHRARTRRRRHHFPGASNLLHHHQITQTPNVTTMQSTKMHQLIQQLENYTESWKQFIHFVNVARGKKYGPEDESQFLETKTVIIQQLELILASIEAGTPSKEEVLNLVGSAPSLRFLSELNDSALRNLESQWHKLY